MDKEYREETVIKLGNDLCNALKACQKKTLFSGVLRLSVFSTSKVENMHGMFLECRRLIELDLNGFDFSRVSNYQYFMLDGMTYNGRPWEELFQ